MALSSTHPVGAQRTGQDPGAAELPDCGTGLYFTTLVLDELDRSLCNIDNKAGWRKLAGCLGFQDQDVQAFEIAQSKPGHNPTRDMLRAYQSREGGIDYHRFKEALFKIGRRDIVTDYWNDATHGEGLLLERNRSMVRPRPRSDPSLHEPVQPVNGPCNLQHTVSTSVISADTNTPPSEPRAIKAEPERETQLCGPSFNSLRSFESVNQASGDATASAAEPGNVEFPHKRYLIVSSKKEDDQRYCRKLGKILRKKGCNAISIHKLNTQELLNKFSVVDIVLVIYTPKYEEEIQQPWTVNGRLFTRMQLEYNSYGQRNRRFIPLYDNDVITKLPVELIGSSTAETNLVLGMLDPDDCRSPANGAPPMPNGACPRPALGPSQGNNLSPNNLSPGSQSPAPRSSARSSRTKKPFILRKLHLN